MFLISIVYHSQDLSASERSQQLDRLLFGFRELDVNPTRLMLALAAYFYEDFDQIVALAERWPTKTLLEAMPARDIRDRLQDELVRRFPRPSDFRALLQAVIGEAIEMLRDDVGLADPRPTRSPSCPTTPSRTVTHIPRVGLIPPSPARTPSRPSLLKRLSSRFRKEPATFELSVTHIPRAELIPASPARTPSRPLLKRLSSRFRKEPVTFELPPPPPLLEPFEIVRALK